MVEVQTSEDLWGDFFFGKGNLTVAEITPVHTPSSEIQRESPGIVQ